MGKFFGILFFFLAGYAMASPSMSLEEMQERQKKVEIVQAFSRKVDEIHQENPALYDGVSFFTHLYHACQTLDNDDPRDAMESQLNKVASVIGCYWNDDISLPFKHPKDFKDVHRKKLEKDLEMLWFPNEIDDAHLVHTLGKSSWKVAYSFMAHAHEMTTFFTEHLKSHHQYGKISFFQRSIKCLARSYLAAFKEQSHLGMLFHLGGRMTKEEKLKYLFNDRQILANHFSEISSSKNPLKGNIDFLHGVFAPIQSLSLDNCHENTVDHLAKKLQRFAQIVAAKSVLSTHAMYLSPHYQRNLQDGNTQLNHHEVPCISFAPVENMDLTAFIEFVHHGQNLFFDQFVPSIEPSAGINLYSLDPSQALSIASIARSMDATWGTMMVPSIQKLCENLNFDTIIVKETYFSDHSMDTEIYQQSSQIKEDIASKDVLTSGVLEGFLNYFVRPYMKDGISNQLFRKLYFFHLFLEQSVVGLHHPRLCWESQSTSPCDQEAIQTWESVLGTRLSEVSNNINKTKDDFFQHLYHTYPFYKEVCDLTKALGLFVLDRYQRCYENHASDASKEIASFSP